MNFLKNQDPSKSIYDIVEQDFKITNGVSKKTSLEFTELLSWYKKEKQKKYNPYPK